MYSNPLLRALGGRGAGAPDGFELEKPRSGGHLGVQPELPDPRVVRHQDRPAAGHRDRDQGWLSAGAVEQAQAKVERPDTVAVPGGEVKMPPTGRALVCGTVVVDDKRATQAAAAAWKGTGAMIGQAEQFCRAPIP
ncbi:MAG: hypothetical protein J4F40_15605 [Alphaproteobacteria bacterium]|nr:hypothetical protein [Alphaproteobacteria bacterium]